MALPVVDTVLALARGLFGTVDFVPSAAVESSVDADSRCPADTSQQGFYSGLYVQLALIVALTHAFAVFIRVYVPRMACPLPGSRGVIDTVSTRTFPSLTTYYAERGALTASESSSATPADDGDSSEPLCDPDYVW